MCLNMGSIGYRHALPPPRGAGEEAEGRVEWGLQESLSM